MKTWLRNEYECLHLVSFDILSSTTLMIWTSPDVFVKTLKSSNDVALAKEAWDSQQLYIPSKGAFITEWALNRLLKSPQTLKDVRYWSLLDDILLGTSPSPPLWLSTVLHKIPVVPILTAVLHILPSWERDQMGGLKKCVPVLKILLSRAFAKTRLDTILDCFWACLEATATVEFTEDTVSILSVAVEGFLTAFSNASNKAKVGLSSLRF